MDAAPVSGPSRPRRTDAPDLADRIISLQRKNASQPGAGPSRRPQARRTEKDEFSRGGDGPVVPRALYDPSDGSRAHPHHADRSSQRTLFDPTRPTAPVVPRLTVSPQPLTPPLPRSNANGSPRQDPEDRQRLQWQEHPRRPEAPGKKLFNPDIHDPLRFHPRTTIAPPRDSTSASSRLTLRRPLVNGRTPEEEADRERERRKRREGSERGSVLSKKKGSDARSKESRSSEGSESLKDRERGKGNGDNGAKAILKDLHNKIRALEQDLTEIHRQMAQDPAAGISVLLDRPIDPFSREIRTVAEDTGRWMGLIMRHKELADLHHEFLERVFDPLVPATFQQLAVRYNIASRLWQTGFHLILERLRHAWMNHQPAALDLLTDLVYDAYKFYTELLEDQSLINFRTAWIEALGDLARYRMAIASRLAAETKPRPVAPVLGKNDDEHEPFSSGASIGAEVAESWDVEDKETWRTTARDWYSMGITEKPGEGRLHHHLALLSQDVPGLEATALHHFTKSLVVTHQFETSRESILPLFNSALQSQRSLPEATAMDLFVRLHGMLFTRISLDNLPAVMSRFMERLEEDASLDGVSRKATITQVAWMLMANVNLAAILQYGTATGVVRRALAQEGQERRRMQAVASEEDGDGENEGEALEPAAPVVEEGEVPPPSTNDVPITPTYTYALQLAFEVFRFTLGHPNRLQGLYSVLNPYLTLFCTFLSTMFRQPHVGNLFISSVPWVELVDFINAANLDIREETRLAFGPPLPEDWTVRGMEWVGRRTYERGFWKAKGSARSSGALAQPRVGERFQSEMDVLLANFDSSIDISEGVVDEVDGTDLTDGPVAVNQRRWRRVTWAAGVLVKHVDGLCLEQDGKITIEGPLQARLLEIADAKKAEAEQLEQSQRRAKAVLPVQDEDEDVVESDGEGEDEADDPDLAVLRERQRYLRSLLNAPLSKPKSATRARPSRKALHVVPGYTMLVFDTNVLLSALSLFSRVVEGGQWSVVVPLPVVTELDGLSKSAAPLGAAAQSAITYLESRIRTHSLCLKIQTSRGNYLSDLLIRTENHDNRTSKTMDDLILGIASFQAEHFVDRSALLGAAGGGPNATKVLLVTFDRNLRLKARSVGVDAADEKEMAAILGKG